MKTVNPGKVTFRDQIRLCLQPMLHLVTGLRTLILISKVSFPGHLIWRGRKIGFILVRACD